MLTLRDEQLVALRAAQRRRVAARLAARVAPRVPEIGDGPALLGRVVSLLERAEAAGLATEGELSAFLLRELRRSSP